MMAENLKGYARKYAEKIALGIKADTGDWIYARLVEAAKTCKSNNLDDIADVIYAEADRYIDEHIEEYGEYGGYGFGGIGGDKRGMGNTWKGARIA